MLITGIKLSAGMCYPRETGWDLGCRDQSLGVGLRHLGPGPLPLCWLSSLVRQVQGHSRFLVCFCFVLFGYLSLNFY